MKPACFLLATAVMCLAGCTTSESRDVVGPPAGGPDTTGGEVPRARLTVTAQLGLEDSAIARVLGWEERRVPGATIEVQRRFSTGTWSATADARGVTTLDDLLPGLYSIGVLRTFTTAEAQALAAAGVEVDALGGASGISVAAPGTSTTAMLVAGRRGSLVISEMTASRRYSQSAGDYFNWQWLEIYNNSDTTIFLDGKSVLKAFPGGYDYPNFGCARYEDIRRDSLGIWGRFLWRFPGTGTTYPLAPGGIATLAVDALDHQSLIHDAHDLTSAPFEFRGSSDANNPAAADLISIGPTHASAIYGGGGFILHENREVIAIADFVEVRSLPTRFIPGTTTTLVRLPAERIIDVAVHRKEFQETAAPCGESSVHPRFDRQDARLLTNYDARSMHRKVLRTLPDGRRILQRTGTSSRDFEARTPTPFAFP